MVKKIISPFSLYILTSFSSIKLNCSLSSSIGPVAPERRVAVTNSTVNDPAVSFLGACYRISFKKKMWGYVIMRNNKQV